MTSRKSTAWRAAVAGLFALGACASTPPKAGAPLSDSARAEYQAVLSDEFCPCGCPHTLGACLDGHACSHAQRAARLARAQVASGMSATEVIGGLSKRYRSFKAPRADLPVDPRMCMGNAQGKLTLVAFSDFECPYCAMARGVLEEVAKSQKEVRICFAPFPLDGHPNALPAAQAALLARDQGKFWRVHDALFENQLALSKALIVQVSSASGVPATALQKAFDEGRYLEELKASKERGKAAGVESTPTLFLNGRKLTMGLRNEVLAQEIEEELEWQANGSAWAAD